MIDVRRAADRARTIAAGIDSRHSFSYGPHYDPGNLGFGILLVNNEDRLAPGAGFDRHRHRDVDIVTWMISGTLEHEDSTGHRHVLTAGMAQHLAAGSGVDHAEHASTDGAHYVQMWVRSSDSPGPRYAAADFTEALAAASQLPALVPVASGMRPEDDTAALRLDQPEAEFAVARPRIGESIDLPGAPLVHVFVARGLLDLTVAPNRSTVRPGDTVQPGDTVRLTDVRGGRLTAAEDSEILVWVLHR